MGVQNDKATEENNWQFLTKLNIYLLYDPAIKLLGINPKDLKTYVYTTACLQMFATILFLIDKTWKQLRGSSVNEWIHKLWYIATLECF